MIISQNSLTYKHVPFIFKCFHDEQHAHCHEKESIMKEPN